MEDPGLNEFETPMKLENEQSPNQYPPENVLKHYFEILTKQMNEIKQH